MFSMFSLSALPSLPVIHTGFGPWPDLAILMALSFALVMAVLEAIRYTLMLLAQCLGQLLLVLWALLRLFAPILAICLFPLFVAAWLLRRSLAGLRPRSPASVSSGVVSSSPAGQFLVR